MQNLQLNAEDLFDNNQIIELKEIFNKKEITDIALKINEKGICPFLFSLCLYVIRW